MPVQLLKLIFFVHLFVVIARINLYPEESTIKIKHGVYSLPIHLACTRKPTLSTILAMIAADPRTLKVSGNNSVLVILYTISHHLCDYFLCLQG